MNTILKYLLIMFLAFIKVSAQAHPGHGNYEHHQPAHYIFSAAHLTELIAIITVICITVFFSYYTFRTMNSEKSKHPD